MTKDEMAQRVEKICQTYDAIFNNKDVWWEWGWYYVEFCEACEILVPNPEGEGAKKDKKNKLREKFTKWMRKVIRQADYSPRLVTERKLELVDAVLAFEP